MSWSYGLLDERLQRTFADLSVFAGSFTAADAAAICTADPDTMTGELAELAERSLVMRAPTRRYVLLETLRAFGAEQLANAGRVEATGDRHARHQVAWIEHADLQMLADGPPAVAMIDAALPELRAALGWLLDHDQNELAGRLVIALADYGLLRQRPDVLAWAQRVCDADTDDDSPVAARVLAVAAYAVWMAGDQVATARHCERALRASDRAGDGVPALLAAICGTSELFEGRLAEAVEWYRRAVETAVDDPAQRLIAAASEVLARSYGDDPTARALADGLLADVGTTVNPYAAYVWYCAGEADLATDIERAKARLTHAIHLAELTNAAFVTGIAGASRASIDARHGDPVAAAQEYRQLIVQWRRAGVWSTQWTVLRSIAVLLERLGRPRDAAVLEGAVRAGAAGHRIVGADAVALSELGARLRGLLGEEPYDSARREGAMLDGDAAVEHALQSL